ncbi:cobalamin-5'-phosphate synthase [Chitinophaga terrae (ex Kim and Jung 2007)]|jgi:adenosylcobinamide-GDP ribazoletransferase|uniref:Adenosylcobinamide-GDP ribazoletransferase n=1 Tax=Chitinophaga terrae (ex Kim and Jung 2007) TaxID=408074 RepID=A0A1H3Y0W6_9BACT|nr:adenosylcobinamide-GDP ribazoletransferase [Chitinophaga terrae (ex Kim and Jung 2007)]MDQ0108122.1 adenosylcobinamide-GDP ribazoletransferase [Chitinophaga terrae (ex Kim and Jung 2007)]GEP89473.1 adenosylcobinamide-GDP ribazoletransferase [Chitinophaga terrae (ex Kim and Jung 2007)]SEA04428.1 cobalamin-5'-phosphate synthase [Chitinophaga terrae (ex Kim and Jung 2007)]
MRAQWQLVLTAIMFYTRLPIPSDTPYSADMLNKATRYLPLVGWVTGAIMVAVVLVFKHISPPMVTILLSLIMGVWVTGAFHEDGFADMCDGFGGGWTKEKILEIMKDSRIGTYGMLGLLSIMTLKFLCLREMPLLLVMLTIASAQPLSRFVAVTVIYTHRYVREDEQSKAKPIAKGITKNDLLVAAVLGIVPFAGVVLYLQNYTLLLIFPALLIGRLYLVRLMNRWLGGYTGDCLGAVQQISETIIYLSFCSLTWKYI